MQELCNLSYAVLAQNRDRRQMVELDTMLIEPEKKKEAYDKVNAASMSQLGLAPLIPLRPRDSSN